MRYLRVIFLILAVMIIQPANTMAAADKANQDNSLKDISNFRVYYDEITPEILSEMKLFDLVIVETLYFDSKYVEELHASGTKVYGYLSLMETPTWDGEVTSLMNDDCYLRVNGIQQFTAKYPIGDLREKSFRDVLIKVTKSRVERLNLDGIFLDSTGNMSTYLKRKDIGESLTEGYIELVKELDATFPKLAIMQNRGFNWIEYSAPYLDSILWEGFKSPLTDSKRSRYWRRIEMLKNLGIDVALLSNDDNILNKKHAEVLGWTYLYHPEGSYYNNWINPALDELIMK